MAAAYQRLNFVDGLANLFWLVLFVVVGYPIALGIELFLRAQKKADAVRPLHDIEFMPVPDESAIARRRIREPATAAISEQD